MTSSSKLTFGIILTISGLFLILLGIGLTATTIGACIGLPMILLGIPLEIWGAVWVWQWKIKRAEEAIAKGVSQGIQQATAGRTPSGSSQAAFPQTPASVPPVLPPKDHK